MQEQEEEQEKLSFQRLTGLAVMAEQLGVAKKSFEKEIFEMKTILQEHPNLIQRISDTITPYTPGLHMMLEVLGQLHSEDAHNVLIDRVILNKGNFSCCLFFIFS